MMKSLVSIVVVSFLQLVIAVPDPLITPRAELVRRQKNADPALLGWVSSSGASEFSDQRSCDFPATLSKSGSYAQCCAPNKPCPFFTTCSSGNLLGPSSASVFCDQGYCNTGVIVPTAGAKGGENYLGCWGTSLGKDSFTLVADVGSAAAVAQPTAASSTSSSEDSSDSSEESSTDSSSGASQTSDSSSEASESGSTVNKTPTGAAPTKTGAASRTEFAGVTGIFGLIAGFFILL